MIETHFDPDTALTDPAQQISPESLKNLLANLIVRKRSGSIEFENILEGLRTEIDKLDGELIDLLAKRMRVVDEIGQYKRENNITILQLKRWQHIIEDRLAIGENLGLNKKFLLQLLELVHEASIQRQTEIFSNQINPDSIR
jgi:chorismate mutase